MKNFVRIETTVQHVGVRFKKEVVIKKFQTEDGLTHEFTTWNREGARSCAVIALTADKKVIVVYEFRGGPERWMYELPGGGIKDGEDPKDGVLRELREETGYEPGHIEFLGASCRDSLSNLTSYYFLATDCTLHAQGSDLDDEEHEQGVEVRLISIEEFLDNAKRGEMTDPTAVLMAYDKVKEIASHD